MAISRRSAPLLFSLCLVAAGFVMGPAEGVEAGEEDRVAGEYLIDLKPGVSAKRFAKKIAREYGGEATFTYDEVVGGFAFKGSDSAAQRLKRDKRVELVEQDRVVRVADAPPDNLSYLNRTKTVDAFNAGHTGAGVRIAVLDTGVDGGHEVFQAHSNVLPGHGSCGGSSGTNDLNGHGTATAGNAAGRIGVAHEANIIPVKVFPGASLSTTWSRVVCGLEWVKANSSQVDIVNISIAGAGNGALRKAIASVLAEGIVVVAAAGNSGGATQAPARYRGVIAATALAGGNAMARFSSSGGDLTAPGVGIHSADRNGGFSSRSGTSRSSPMVAGAAAIVLAEDPAANVLDVLRTSGTCPDDQVNGSSGFCAGRWRSDDSNAEPLINAYCAGVFADPVAVDLAGCGF